MDEELLEKAQAYANAGNRQLGECLGFGIHGIVVVLKSEAELGDTALKVFFAREPYQRERDAYERLTEARVRRICGFHVPQFLRCDDALLALEMTVVSPPYFLDFAGAWLDFPPKFPDEVWADWERKNQEQFGEDWPMAQTILTELEDFGIHMLDPSPSNIRFR
jgi:hypothetical protein